MKSPSNKEVIMFYVGAVLIAFGAGTFLAWLIVKSVGS